MFENGLFVKANRVPGGSITPKRLNEELYIQRLTSIVIANLQSVVFPVDWSIIYANGQFCVAGIYNTCQVN